MAEAYRFDIIGCMITEKGLTGENISRQIFSYLDFSSLRDARMVSKTWNQFLMQHRSIWMDFLKKLEPYLQYCDNLPTLKLAKNLPKPWVSLAEWKVVFDSINKEGKIEDIIDTFLSIQGYAVTGWGNPKYFAPASGYWPDEPPIKPQPFKNAEIFQRSWLGKKFYLEVLPSRWKFIIHIRKNTKWTWRFDTESVATENCEVFSYAFEQSQALELYKRLQKRIRTNFKLIQRKSGRRSMNRKKST